MIPQITEINFPAYATLNNATVTLAEMGDRTITTQIKIDGDVVPDFAGWALEFKGERFVLPTREPQAAKDNTSRRSTVDLTFTSWAVNELKRYFFVEMASITAGTAIADKYKASLGLSLENFVTAFNNVLDYYFNGQIHMDLFGAGTGLYSQEPSFIEIDYTYIWEVLQKVYEIYNVRWAFTYDNENQRYLIKVGYPAPEIDDHDFEYGYAGGLLRFERQVQDYDITNLLLGRGGEKNLPYRYFKKTDPNNTEWQADPDAVPELKNIYFENLRDINFRRYVQGWKTNPNRMLETGDVVETYDTERAETDWAYAKGHTDEKFNPVEYVKDDDSIALYGEHWGALDNNENIYPTIQGIEVSPFGRIDEVVDVESVTTDDIEAMAADAAEITNVNGATKTEWINYNSRITVEINGPDFTVPANKVGNLTMVGTWVNTVEYGKKGNHQDNIDPDSAIRSLVNIDTSNSYIVAVDKTNGQEHPISGLAAGSYYYKMHIEVRSEFEQEQYDKVNVTVGVNGMKLTVSDGMANAWKPTFDIWVKNIWNTTQGVSESDAAYAARVWGPILGDRTGNEAAVVFSTGFLSISADYNFTIASIPVVDRTKTIDGVSSEWRITLIKSDAEYDATGKYIPNADTGGNAQAGDFFYFTGIDMPWIYVQWAEERLNAYKETELAKMKQINPTWVVQIDKVRANTKEQGELEFLADRFASGAKLRVRDKRFTNNNILTLYVQTVTYTWQQPSSGNPYLVPDIEVVLSDKIVSVESPIARLEGSVDLIQTSYAKISDIEGAIRRVASPLFLKKTGESEKSLSPTRFSSIVASENFRQGDIGGQGWGAYVDGNGHTVLETDTVVVRKDMRVNTLTVNQIAYLGGKQIISAAAMECIRVEEVSGGYKCYFDQKQGSVANLFKVDDVVLGQVWNADESEQRYYKRKVIAIDSDSITLSSSIADGTGIPQPKDVMVQYGSYTDTSRQYVILRDVIGGGYERMLSGLTSVYTDGTEYYFAGRQDGSTPRWFVGDALGQYASYQNGVLNIAGRLAVTTQIDTGNGSYTALSSYLSNLQDQIDGNIQTWYASGVPTLNNYPANTWPTVEDKNNHIGDLYYDSDTGKAHRFMYDGTNEVYLWTQLADEDIAAALALAQQNQTAINGLQYLKAATNQGTLVQGGLVLTSMIQLGQTEQGVYKVYSGINGIMDPTALGSGIAAWYGGQMADKVADNTLTNYAKSLFRFDGSGYLASGNIKWDLNGNGEIPGISWNNGRITLSSDIYLQGGDRLTALIDAVNRMYSQFAYDSADHITVAPTHALYIPTQSPQYPIAGKVALYYDYQGNYAETPSGGGTATIYDLTIRKNSSVLATVNLGVQAADINIPIGWGDLTEDASHKFVSQTEKNAWNAKADASALADYLPLSAGSGKALTGNLYMNAQTVELISSYNSPSFKIFSYNQSTLDVGGTDRTKGLHLNGSPIVLHSGGTNTIRFASTAFRPTDATNSLTLGDSTYKWSALYATTLYGNLNLSYLQNADDLKAIEALTGTSGFLKKTAANTWALDTAPDASTLNGKTAAEILSGVESLKTTSENDAMFTFRKTPSVAVGDMAKVLCVKGKSIVWNQLVDTGTTSVTIPSGHKYYSIINGVRSVGTSTGAAIAVTGGTDMVFDLTQMFGSTIAATMTAADFEALYSLDYYNYNAGELVNNAASGVEMLDSGGSSLGVVDLDITDLVPANKPTVRLNQLIKKATINATSNGVTLSNSGTNTFTLNGLASANGNFYMSSATYIDSLFPANHYIYYNMSIISGSFTGTIRFGGAYAGKPDIGAQGVSIITKYTSTNYPTLSFLSGADITSLKFHLMAIDLTEMYGSGNEPTSSAVVEELIGGYVEPTTGTDIPNRIYPKGAKSAGTAHDIIRQTDTDRVIGVVDLGTLNWNSPNYSSTTWRASSTSLANLIKKPADNSTVANVMCVKYMAATANQSYLHSSDNIIAVDAGGTGTIFIYSTEFSNGSYTAADIKAALSGVLLYYEQATPEHFDLLNPIQQLVACDPDGTQRRLPVDTASSVSAPMVCDFQYGVNPSDTFNELENDLDNLKISDIIGATAIGSATQPVFYNGSAFTACDLSTTYAPYNADGYLPLSAGSTKPLTGALYFGNASIFHASNVLSLVSTGNELCISGGADGAIAINYRKAHDGYAATQFIWRAGTSTSWATFQLGDIKPGATDTYALGTSSLKWNSIHVNAANLYGNITIDASAAARNIYYKDSATHNLRAMILGTDGHLSIGYDNPTYSKNTYIDGLSEYLRFGSTKQYALTLDGSNGRATLNCPLLPSGNGIDLGSSSAKWGCLYTNGIDTGDLGVSGYVMTHLIPDDNIFDLGSTSTNWRALYVGDITAGGDVQVDGTIHADGNISSDSNVVAYGLEATDEVIIPTSAPSSPASGKVYLYCNPTGNYYQS